MAAATVASLAVEITGDVSGLNRAFNTADKGVKRFGGKLSKGLKDIGSEMTDFGVSLGVLTAPLLGLGALAINASIEFESAFANVEKTVDASEDELAQLRDTLRDMATGDSPLASMDNALITLTNIAAMGGSLGIAVDNLDEFVTTVALLDAASDDLDAETAAAFIGQFANVTGLPTEDFDNLADAIVTLGNNMATTEGQIAAFATRLAPLANYNWAPEAIIAYSAALASLGVSPELGATNLLKSIQDLTMAVATGGPQLQGWATAAGMSADAFAALANADPEGAFNAFIQGLAGMDADEQLRTLHALGITSNEQITTIQRLAGGYDTLTDALTLSTGAWAGNGAALAEAEAKADTTQGAINRLNNQFNEMLITIGDQLTGKLADVARGLTPVIADITRWASENPELVTTIAAVTLGVGTLAAGLAAAGIVVSAIATGFGVMAAAVGLVSLPMVALVAAVGLFVATWNALGPGLIESWGAAFTQIGLFIQNVINKVNELLGKIGEVLAAIPGMQPSIGAQAADMFNRPGGLGDFIDGSHATGLRTVPSDGYRAILHKGEAVLKRGDADAWRQGGGGMGGGVTVNVFPNNLMGSRQEVIEWVREGMAEAGL